jgi:hypothetical protein
VEVEDDVEEDSPPVKESRPSPEIEDSRMTMRMQMKK